MMRVKTDFQALDPDGFLFILKVNNVDIDQQAEELGIKVGDEIILDAYEDFEIIGTLDVRFVDLLQKETWVANPDWSTRRERTTL